MAPGLKADLMQNAPDDLGITGNAQKDMPWWYNAWQNTPPWYAGMGFTAFRGSSTILNGGWAKSAFPGGGRFSPDVLRRMRYKMDPRSMFKYSHSDWIDPVGKHNVFQMSRVIDPVLRAAGATRDAESGKVLSGGLWSTQSAASRLAHMKSVTESTASNVSNYIQMADPSLFGRLGGAEAGYYGPAFGGEAGAQATVRGMDSLNLSQTLRGAARGSWNRGIGGYFAGASDVIGRDAFTYGSKEFLSGATRSAEGLAYGGFLPGESIGAKGFVQGMSRAFGGRGVEMAGEKFAGSAITGAGRELIETGVDRAAARVGEGLLAKGAEGLAARAGVGMAARFGAVAAADAIGFAIPVVNVALAAWTVYDISKTLVGLAGDAAKATTAMTKDAMKSFKGGIDKAPMSGYRGLGYIDTSAAASSRRRGVMAISNSRLNARSVLGSEAPMLHAHFG